MELYTKIIIVSLVALILLTILIIAIYYKTKKDKLEPLDSKFLDDLYIALGIGNIESVDIEHRRIRLILKEVKDVDANALQQLKVPAFLKGKELKILIKDHTKEVYNYLTERGSKNE